MIRVLIADDHPAVRAGLASELGRQPDITVVGLAGNAEETLRLAQDREPDVVLLDVMMPGIRAGELIGRLRRMCPKVRVLVLSAYDEERLVLGLLRAGAQGYLLKEEELERVVAAVRSVMRGEMPLSPAVAAEVRRAAVGDQGEGSLLAQLTEREREVLVLMAQGLSNAEGGVRDHGAHGEVSCGEHLCEVGGTVTGGGDSGSDTGRDRGVGQREGLQLSVLKDGWKARS